MIRRLNGASKAILAAALIYPQLSLADESKFTSADVLAWEEPAQDNYFQTSIVMVGIVATQTDPSGATADCIRTWYADEFVEERNGKIRAVMEQFPDHHPQIMILAVIEDVCGEFGRR